MSILKRALSLVLLLSLAAIPTSGVQASNSEANSLTAAETVYTYLLERSFDAVADMLDDNVKAMLSGDAFETAYTSQIEPAGKFVDIVDKKVATANGAVTVTLIAGHENGQVQLTCVFTTEGKITGIGLVNLSAAAEVADPLPLDLPNGAVERKVTLHPGTEKELTGALVLPQGFTEDTSVVVMAHGSGISDLDETIGPNKPFRDIAYGLAAHGIASIRYDKLHYAHPELATVDLTIDDEYTDTVLEALAVVRTEEKLGRAYLLGHSEGGMFTPYLMAKSEGGFYGGIISAGTPRQLWELIYDQSIAMLEGAPKEQLDTVIAQLDAEKEKLATLDGMSEEALRSITVFNMPGPYVAHMSGIDAIAHAHENNAPLLILQGEEDFQVYYDVDFAAWQEGLKDMGDLVSYKSYPGLNHLLMTARGSIKDAMQAYATPDLVAEEVIDDIAHWINDHN